MFSGSFQDFCKIWFVILLSSVDALELVCRECDGDLVLVLIRLLEKMKEILLHRRIS